MQTAETSTERDAVFVAQPVVIIPIHKQIAYF